MAEQSDILILARKAAEIKILYLPHALRQMSRPDRMISVTEIRNVVEHGEVIEDYPEDQRGHSCLIMGYGNNSCCLFSQRGFFSDYHSLYSTYRSIGK